MNDIVHPTRDPEARRDQSLRNVGHVSYALHAVVAIGAVVPAFQPSIVLLIAAFVIDLVKRADAAGTWHESHFRWRIRSVVWAAVLYVLTLPLWFFFVLPGWIAWGLISLWFLYRVARGWLSLNDRKPMPV
ncbi:DUF4870 family protein [Azohydromonas sediminis]|uniref:DUF4870 family protein n=1 Tax=Azohydromonas sediminis TaxID=2259674 RepID=UPI000E65B0E9|nr:hypothetical protein [Azohydromonas sediminis]